MSRLRILGTIALCVQFMFVTPVLARGSKIAAAMGDLRWGMSEFEVERFAERHLKNHYAREIAKARSAAKKQHLKEQLDVRLRRLADAYVEFQGQPTRWDKSPVVGEFSHGNDEGLIAVEDTNSKNYYFFVEGQLWKWVKVLDASVFGGKSFDRFAKVMQRRFGRGIVKEGPRLSGRDDEQRWVEFLDRRSRLRAVDQTEEQGAYNLVFEHMDTVRGLQARRGRPSEDKVRVAGRAGRGSDRSAREPEQDAKPTKARRSIFADERRSDGRYARRQKGAKAAQQAKQVRPSRPRRASHDSALKGVSGSESDDPLAGL